MKETIFRERDIRGSYPDEINEEVFKKIGNAFAQLSEKDIIVACDARNESISLMNAFANGALEAEKTVMNIGTVPQACAINWTAVQQMELAYITGSHLPKGRNGVKFFHHNGKIYNKEDVEKISGLVKSGKYFSGLKATQVREEIQNVYDIYKKSITEKVKSDAKKKTKILIDCGNGVNGLVARDVFTQAGFDVDVIFENPDGNFPNRGPDPRTDPLDELKKSVGKYEFGIAYDADGDRFFVMSQDGKMLTTEQIVYVLLSGLNQDGDVVVNVECGRAINSVSEKFGRKIITVKVGQYSMEEAVIKNDAIFGIESSHHSFVPFVSKFSDTIATSMVFSKAVEDSGKSLKDLIRDVPVYPATKKYYDCPDEKKFEVMESLKNKISSRYANVSTIDGIRVDLDSGFVLIRPSQTEGIIRMNVEADDEPTLKRLEEEFSSIVENEVSNS